MKADLNTKLHAAAIELVGKDKAHEMLHLTIKQHPFFKDSLKDLTDKEAMALLVELQDESKRRKQQIAGALGQPLLISERQLSYAKDMIEALGWSKAYLATVLSNRYQHEEELETMTAAKAVLLVAYLKQRVESKRGARHAVPLQK